MASSMKKTLSQVQNIVQKEKDHREDKVKCGYLTLCRGKYGNRDRFDMSLYQCSGSALDAADPVYHGRADPQ